MTSIKDALNIAETHSAPLGKVNNTNVYTERQVTQFNIELDTIKHVDFHHDSHLDPQKSLLSADRRFDVYALKDDKEMSRQVIGRELVPCKPVYMLETGPYQHHPIPPLQPAVAALENPVIDRNFSAALNAANAFFLRGNEAKLTGSDAGLIFGLKSKIFDPTRLVFKMAQMWWYHVLMERENLKPTVSGAVNDAARIESVARLRACLTDGLADTSVLFIDLTKVAGQEALVLSVLRKLVAETQMTEQSTSLPTIITKPIALGSVGVYYTSIQEHNTTYDAFTSHQVWNACTLWCAQYGITDMLMQHIRSVGSLLHSHHEHLDPIYCAGRLHISLPVLLLSPGALTPLSVAADALNPTMITDPPNPVTLVAELILRNQLLGAAMQEVIWDHGMTVKRVYVEEDEASKRRMLTLFDRRATGYVPALALACKAVCKLAIEVRVGKFIANLRPAGEYLKQDMQKLSEVAFSWEEAYDMFPTVPSMSLAALTQPKRAREIIQPGLYYQVSEVFNAVDCGTLEALQLCNVEMHFWERRPREISFNCHPLPVRNNYRNVLCDRPLPNFSLFSGREVVITAKARTDADAMKLYRHRLGESSWDWFSQRSVGGPDTSWRPDWSSPTPNNGVGVFLSSGATTAGKNDEDLGKPNPEPEHPSEEKDRLAALIADKIKEQAQEKKIGESSGLRIGKTQADRLARVKKYLTGGVWGALFSAYETSYNGKDIAQGMTMDHYFNAVTPTVSTQLAGISLATALPPIPFKERQTICKDVAALCRRVAALGNSHVATQKLCDFSVKSDNLAVVMGRNPAVSTEELRSLGYTLPDEAADLDDMAPAILEFGGTLADYAGFPGKVLTHISSPGDLDWDNHIANGFKKSKDQSGVPRGNFRLEKAEGPSNPKKGIMDFYMSMGEDSEKFQKAVDDLVKKLAPPPQKPNTREEFDRKYFHNGDYEFDLATEEGRLAEKWLAEFEEETKLPEREVPENWNDDLPPLTPEADFPVPSQGGAMPPGPSPAATQADVADPTTTVPDIPPSMSEEPDSGSAGPSAEDVSEVPTSGGPLSTQGPLDMADS